MKRATKKSRKIHSPAARTPPGLLRSRFSTDTLRQHFVRLFQPNELTGWLPVKGRGFYQRIFPPMIVLWYFIYLRMADGHRLYDVITDAHQGGADGLTDPGKPLSKRLRSWATTSFCKARQRFPLAALEQALPAQAQKIRAWAQDLKWNGWNVFLLDGSTVRRRPLGDMPKHFPPHKNRQPQKEYGCLMRVVVCFCLRSAVLTASVAGAITTGEQALACALIASAAPLSLFVGNRNFGIFRMLQAVRHAGGQALFRLTEARARKLVNGGKLTPGLDVNVQWTHSRYDQIDGAMSTEPISGRLLVVQLERRGFRQVVLYLFTTLPTADRYSVAQLVELYGRRWQVELNLRHLKTQMALEALECKSAAMARKEWLAGVMTYNLIRAAMLVVAIDAKIPLLNLSFSAAKCLVARWLNEHFKGPKASVTAWQVLCEGVAQARQPKRSKPRPAEPRAIRRYHSAVPSLFGSRQKARQAMENIPAKS